ncbi:MAG: DUF1573 domain-containing protein [Phycisphaeraceae bacterium]|nr:DUF1573 domain-containing protein [Phycisphaeraceae bacterium]
MIFDAVEVDLGNVSDAADVSHAFSFVNASERSVRVELRNYCTHCEKPEIVPGLVGSGRTGVVIVDMKTAGMSGLIRGGATIGVQGLDQPTVELKLTATVVPDAAFDPPMLRIDETPIGAGGSGEVALIVRTPGSGVRSIVSSVPSFVAEAGEPEEIKIDATTGTKIPIRVRVGSELPAGYHVADLRVETTGGSWVHLPVSVQVLPSLVANPADIGLGLRVGGDEFKALVSVTSRDGTPVRISSIGLADSSVHTAGSVRSPISRLTDLNIALAVEEPNMVAKITVSGRAPLSTGGYEFILNVQGQQGSGDVLAVPVRFRVRY